MKLKSADPKETPSINFKYFHDENNGMTEDLHAVFQGLKVARDLNTKIGAKYLKQEVNPRPQLQSEQDLKAWIMKEAWGHHASDFNDVKIFRWLIKTISLNLLRLYWLSSVNLFYRHLFFGLVFSDKFDTSELNHELYLA